MSSPNKTDECQCKGPENGERTFWCEPHQCNKTQHWQKLCETNEQYRNAWNAGVGPGQITPSAATPVSRERRPCRDHIHSELVRRILAICEHCEHYPCAGGSKCEHENALRVGGVELFGDPQSCPYGLWQVGNQEVKTERKAPESRLDQNVTVAMEPVIYASTGPPLPPVSNLAVVTCFYNPCGYANPRMNYRRFASDMTQFGVDLWTVEMALDDDPFEIPSGPRVIQVRGTRARNLLWQKERLINLGIQALPKKVDAIGWIDCDVMFTNSNWVSQSIESLQRCQVIQPFKISYFTDSTGAMAKQRESLGGLYQESPGGQDYLNLAKAHPGFAWIARAEWLREVGLYDRVVTGGGDTAMVPGVAGCGEPRLFSSLSESLRLDLRRWCGAARSLVQGRLGAIPGSVIHLYHGDWVDRRYAERWKYFIDHNYDPVGDLEVDANGLLAWTEAARRHKRPMVESVANYFTERKEDG